IRSASEIRVFFFFQAEDGIRDGHVTGVQTCALPISSTVVTRRPPHSTPSTRHDSTGWSSSRTAHAPHSPSSQPCFVPHRFRSSRSEERRVGKECRSRGSGYEVKKKKENRRG